METILTLDNISEIAQTIIKEARKSAPNKAVIIAFSGDLGAGKTTITKEISRQLGIMESVSSPTFVIMKIYKTKDTQFKNLVHIDAYRLEKCEELKHLGWEEIISNKENLIVIEWPENVAECIPQDALKVSLEHKDERTRSIKFCYN